MDREPIDDPQNELPCPYESAYIFLKGSCNIFAYALKEAFEDYIPLQVNNINDESQVIHCYCKAGDRDRYVDVRGAFDSEEELLQKFGGMNKLSKPQLMNTCFNEDYFEEGYEFAKQIIKKMKDWYKVE